MIKIDDVLSIDGGLSYLQTLFPDAKEGENFKLREGEKTASASMKKLRNGNYAITDFGDNGKAKNAVDCAMIVHGLGFVDALKLVAAHYNIVSADKPYTLTEAKAKMESWDAKPDEVEGQTTWQTKEFDDYELKTVISQKVWDSLGSADDERRKNAITKMGFLHFKALEWYQKTTDGKTIRWSATEQFPIFLIDEGDGNRKIYKPKDQKQYRFLWVEKSTEKLIHGLAQARAKYVENGETKLDAIIICTGGSDAINVFCAGYHPIWLNSESQTISKHDYIQLVRIAQKVYYLGDLDDTGKKKSHEIGMEFIDIRIIELPAELSLKRDLRGNPCKDVRDYFRHWKPYDFKYLVDTALPYRFWDIDNVTDKDGNPKYKFGEPLIRYVANNVNLYNFLYKNGFARFASRKEKDGYTYIKVTSGVVEEIKPSKVKDFIHDFLEERKLPIELRNSMYNTPRLSENSLSNLKYFVGDFKNYGPDYQYFFFTKKAWRISANKVEEEKLGQNSKNIWVQKVLDRDPKVLPPMFEISKNQADQWDIKVLDTRCDFFKFLIQTARVHWRTELEERLEFYRLSDAKQDAYLEERGWPKELKKDLLQYAITENSNLYKETYRYAVDGVLLNEEEQHDQKLHLINRIFCIGYALHRYKNPSKPWAVFAMDAKLSEDGESHGGAGKGIVAKGLYNFLTKVQLDGRNKRLTDNPHIFENVSEDTDLVHVEDADEYLPFNFFFAPLTSAMTINPKNKQSFELQYTESPKFWFDTNYGDRFVDPSSLRRKIYTVFSDYYHENKGDYRESRSPADEFGRTLFTDWNADDWEYFDNFMAQCLAFYLGTTEKINPPMENVSKRNLMSEMGDNFREWADIYFDTQSGNLDKLIYKKDAI